MKTPRTKGRTEALPELHNGDRMTQKEFHRIYEAYPEDEKYELIGGTVYMASPLRIDYGAYHLKLGLVLGVYEAWTPGVQATDNVTTILGEESEPQPDLALRLLTECGGQSHRNDKGYLEGAPELVAEIAHSTRAIDMNRKRLDYLEAGVQEYIVLCVEEQELFWFHFPSRSKLRPTRGGVWKSRAFPGLWLDGPALLAHDSAKLIATLPQGLTTPEHTAFVKSLQKARGAGA